MATKEFNKMIILHRQLLPNKHVPILFLIIPFPSHRNCCNEGIITVFLQNTVEHMPQSREPYPNMGNQS